MKRLITIIAVALTGISLIAAETPAQTTADAPAQTAPTQSAGETSPAQSPADVPATAPAQNPAETPAAPTPAPATPVKPEIRYSYDPTKAGDQFIRFGLGIGLPLFNVSPDSIETCTNMYLGGAGSIWYAKYITPRLALGGELNFCFNSTLGENLYFYLPITFKTTYSLIFDRLQVPLSLGAGFAFQAYNGTYYFGPILKPEAGAFWQFSPEWSFGASVNWNIIPQWYKDGANNRTGNILDTVIGVRYHF